MAAATRGVIEDTGRRIHEAASEPEQIAPSLFRGCQRHGFAAGHIPDGGAYLVRGRHGHAAARPVFPGAGAIVVFRGSHRADRGGASY